MKKLKLNLDQIQVISFSPQPPSEGDRGTVKGNATIHIHCSEACFPPDDTFGYCDEGVFTWPTCNDFQTCEGYVCPDIVTKPDIIG